MKSIQDIDSLENVRVIVRASLNVPVESGKVVNTFRLRKAAETIIYLQSRGAKIILIGHLGEEGTETLAPVSEALASIIPHLTFCGETTGEVAAAAILELKAGEVVMLENLRRNPGEIGNIEVFAHELVTLGDIFVQDAFDVCHRSHASVVSLPKLLPSYAGLQLMKEVTVLTKARTPESPSLAIIGGAKFSTKEPVLKELITSYDHVFVGGALANDFIKQQGYEVGESLVSKDADAAEIDVLLQNPKILVPKDVVVAKKDMHEEGSHVSALDAVQVDDVIYDAGPETVHKLIELLKGAKTVVWNGPLGKYEYGYTAGTEALARAIAESGAYSVLGGGDTVAAIEATGTADKFSFISTGGGAMLDFLADGTLPGISVLD